MSHATRAARRSSRTVSLLAGCGLLIMHSASGSVAAQSAIAPSAIERSAIAPSVVAPSVVAGAAGDSTIPQRLTVSQGNQDPTRAQNVDHLIPPRDYQGKQPDVFEWTAARGADEYAIGAWTEVDVMVFRVNHIKGTSVKRPEDVKFEPGTYFWSISALREGQQIGESGLAAFVVREP